MFCWLNGIVLHENEARLPAATAGNLLGWGVFTTIGVRDAQPLFLSRHFARLRHDADAARIPCEISDEVLSAAVHELISCNSVSDGVVRITLTRRGEGRWSCDGDSHCLILAHPRPAPKMDGLKVGVSPFRLARARPLAGIKSTSHLEYQLAFMAAQDAGCDEALLLNDADQVCEAARANVFWVRDGILQTPDLACGALPGVARGVILAAAQELKIAAVEVEASVADLSGVEELFITSATSGPRGVAMLKTESAEIRFVSPGPLKTELREWWNCHA